MANSAGAVSYNNTTAPWLNGVYSVAQNGATGLACGTEYDLFLQPKSGFGGFGSYAAGSPNGLTQSQLLSTLSAISFNLGLNVVYEQQGNNCIHNAVQYMLGIHLYNSSKSKHFFYQIVFRRSNASVPNYEGWIDGHGNAGVDDHISLVSPGAPLPLPGHGRVAYSVNIRDRLIGLINRGWASNGASGSNVTFDNQPGNYAIVGVFLGQALWGNSLGTSEWDNFNLIVAP